MSIVITSFRPEDLQDAMKIEMYSNQLLENDADGSTRLKKEVAHDLAYLFQNRWIGLSSYVQNYARDWINSEKFMNLLQNELERCRTLEEATEVVLTHLKRWGKQVATDFVGAFCFLEAEARAKGSNDEIIHQVRNTDQAYAGYIALREQQLRENAQDGVNRQVSCIVEPLLNAAPGFIGWLIGVVDISLLNRRALIQEALIGEDFHQVILRVLLASQGVIEESSLVGAYFAHVLDLQQYYSIP
jgi:hypothetical protein